MAKKLDKPYHRHHVIIFDDDWDYLNDKFGVGGPASQIGTGRAIRTFIHQRVLGLKAKEAGKLDALRDEQRETGEPGLPAEAVSK